MVRTLGRITLRLLDRLFLSLAWKILIDMVKLVFLAQVNYWINVPGTTQRMSNEWVAKAALTGWPSEHDQILYHAGRVIAFLLLLAGWILNAYLTVWIFQLIFR